MGREVEHVDVGDRVWSVAEDSGEGTMRQFVVTEASRVFRRPQVLNYLTSYTPKSNLTPLLSSVEVRLFFSFYGSSGPLRKPTDRARQKYEKPKTSSFINAK